MFFANPLKKARDAAYYLLLEKEIPILSFLLLTISSSGGSLSDFFRYLSNKRWLVSHREGQKFKMLEKIGESWENIIAYLETRSTSDKYSSFLRGILTVITTSGELAYYSYNIFLESINELRENFSRYSRSIFNIIEINLLLSIAFTTVVISSSLISMKLSEAILPLMTSLMLFSSLVFTGLLEFTKPPIISVPSTNYRFLNALLFVVAFLSYYYHKENLHLLLVSLSTIFFISFAFFLNELRIWRRHRRELLALLHDSAEKRRAGLSFQEAINPDEYDKIYEATKKRRFKDPLTRVIVELMKTVYEYSAGFGSVLDYLYFFAKDIDKLEIRLKIDGILITIFGLVLPALMLYFNLMLLTSLGTGGAPIKNILLFYTLLALVTNLVISKSLDGSFFSGWRVLLALILILVVYKNVFTSL